MIKRTLRAAVLAIGILTASNALADSPSSDFRLDASPAAMFPQGTKAVVSWASYTPPIGYSSDHLADASVGLSYYVWDNHAFNIVADGYHFDQEDGHTAEGSAISLIGRYHFYNHDPFTVYFDGGCGLSWFNSAVPKGGTTYNYVPRLGLGLGYHITDNTWLTTGMRYIHFSNGREHGPEKNPGYEGIECYVGVIITFK